MNNCKAYIEHVKVGIDGLDYYKFRVYKDNRLVLHDSIDDVGQGIDSVVKWIKEYLKDRI